LDPHFKEGTLLRKWAIIGFFRGKLEQGNDDSPDNCAECKKRLKKRKEV